MTPNISFVDGIDKRYGPPMTNTKAYAGPRLIRFLAGAVLVLGLGLAVFGVGYLLAGATDSRAGVTVPVRLVPGTGSVGEDGSVPLTEPRLPDGGRVDAAGDRLTLGAPGSTLAERLLSRGDAVVLGLSCGLGGVLLRRLLLSIAAGRPFERGNARRLASIAVLVAAGGTFAGVLPQVAGLLVLDRLGQAGPGSPFSFGVELPLLPVLAAPLVLVLAEAFRRGAELADDVAGLV